MSLPVRIENDAIRMEVWPQFGGKVSSLIDKADRFELLFNYPAEIPTGSEYGKAYPNAWYSGWDECFPAIAPGPYAGHPYDGIAVPDHGELWGLPTTAVPTKDGITTVWHGLRFGYRLTRKLFLDDATVRAEYTLVNLAPFDFRFVWAMHALMDMNSPVEFSLPDTEYVLSHDAAGTEYGRKFRLEDAGELENLSRPTSLPDQKAWKVYTTAPVKSPIMVRYPSRASARTVALGYDSPDGIDAYWGIWINTGGWVHHRHFALEPTTGRFDQLDRSIRDGSAGRVAPMGRAQWNAWISLAAS